MRWSRMVLLRMSHERKKELLTINRKLIHMHSDTHPNTGYSSSPIWIFIIPIYTRNRNQLIIVNHRTLLYALIINLLFSICLCVFILSLIDRSQEAIVVFEPARIISIQFRFFPRISYCWTYFLSWINQNHFNCNNQNDFVT